ncbi:MAG: hypothetical protein WBE18_05700, partial [Gammaproteobacteria bacterium]
AALLHNSHVFVICMMILSSVREIKSCEAVFGRSNPSSKPGLPRRFAPRNDEKNWIPRGGNKGTEL